VLWLWALDDLFIGFGRVTAFFTPVGIKENVLVHYTI
jgi:hypothetical protein